MNRRRRVPLVLVLVAFVALAGSLAPAGAIVGGSRSTEGSHQFMASLQTAQGDHVCGGSVVAARWILTAAHCSDRRPADARVVVGRTDLARAGGQTLRVTRIVVHPSYAATGTHDVALWRVDRDIASPAIALATARQDAFEREGTTLTVAGWGAELFGSPVAPSRLKQVDVRVVGDARCRTNTGFAPATELCASELGGDSCQGDSGGPLFGYDAWRRPVQVGVVSYGLGCATPGFPGVYAEVNNASIAGFVARTIR